MRLVGLAAVLFGVLGQLVLGSGGVGNGDATNVVYIV